MAIDSTSTRAQIIAEFKDTLGYRFPVNVALAHRHLIAVGIMMMERPTSATKGSNTFGYSPGHLQKLQSDVLQFLSIHDAENQVSGPDVILADFSHNPRSAS